MAWLQDKVHPVVSMVVEEWIEQGGQPVRAALWKSSKQSVLVIGKTAAASMQKTNVDEQNSWLSV